MLLVLFLLAQSPTIITNANVKSVQRCNCKPSQSVMDGFRERQFVYVPPAPLLGPQVVSTGGTYGENLIRVRPMFVAYPYDLRPVDFYPPPYYNIQSRFNHAQIRTDRRVAEDRGRPARLR